MTPSPEQKFTNEDLKQWKLEMEATLDLSEFDKDRALLARMEAHEAMSDYLSHEDHCIRTFWEAGEPTSDGGYQTKFAGKWYQSHPIDETPKCNCGLDEKWEAWRQVSGK